MLAEHQDLSIVYHRQMSLLKLLNEMADSHWNTKTCIDNAGNQSYTAQPPVPLVKVTVSMNWWSDGTALPLGSEQALTSSSSQQIQLDSTSLPGQRSCILVPHHTSQ